MVILLAGNIGSGKTSLSCAFKKLHPEYVQVSIDTCRIQAAGNESRAWALLFNQTANPDHPNVIVESSGLGWRIQHLIKNSQVQKKGLVKILIECEMLICMDRAEATQAERDKVPFPYDFGSVSNSICYMDSKFTDPETLRRLDFNLYLDGQLTPQENALALDQFITQISTEPGPVGLAQ